MRYSHFRHVDAGQWRRKLTAEQAARVIQMKDGRGLTWSAIAAWFQRNGTPISYGAVRDTYKRSKVA